MQMGDVPIDPHGYFARTLDAGHSTSKQSIVATDRALIISRPGSPIYEHKSGNTSPGAQEPRLVIFQSILHIYIIAQETKRPP
jgi:hypothetical protein